MQWVHFIQYVGSLWSDSTLEDQRCSTQITKALQPVSLGTNEISAVHAFRNFLRRWSHRQTSAWWRLWVCVNGCRLKCLWGGGVSDFLRCTNQSRKVQIYFKCLLEHHHSMKYTIVLRFVVNHLLFAALNMCCHMFSSIAPHSPGIFVILSFFSFG